MPRIGILNNLNPAVAAPSTEAFLQGLRERGWIDGKNVTIVYRWADGDLARHPALAAELAKVPVDVIVTAGTQAVVAARRATTTIPIVVAIMPDPVGLGFAASLARPGGNVTGLANLFEEITPKQLQLFREMVPGSKRIALLSDEWALVRPIPWRRGCGPRRCDRRAAQSASSREPFRGRAATASA